MILVSQSIEFSMFTLLNFNLIALLPLNFSLCLCPALVDVSILMYPMVHNSFTKPQISHAVHCRDCLYLKHLRLCSKFLVSNYRLWLYMHPLLGVVYDSECTLLVVNLSYGHERCQANASIVIKSSSYSAHVYLPTINCHYQSLIIVQFHFIQSSASPQCVVALPFIQSGLYVCFLCSCNTGILFERILIFVSDYRNYHRKAGFTRMVRDLVSFKYFWANLVISKVLT